MKGVPYERLRVMHVVLSLNPGGTERLVIEIAKTLAGSVAPVVCCLDEAGGWAGELAAAGVPVAALGRTPGFHPAIGRRLARLADAHRIDVLHFHHYSPFVYGQLAALWRRRLKVVFTEHGRLAAEGLSLKRRLVNPWLGRLPASIHAVSEDLRRHMAAEGFPLRRVSVIHNGIHAGDEPDASSRQAARRSLGLPAGALVIGTVARLDPVKDLPTLIESFAMLRRAAPDSRLVVVGDGPEREALARCAETHGVAGAVLFAGFSGAARALMPAFDVYVNTSTHEGISLTILEAMAAATAVVATSVGGTPEVVQNGETGVLVPPRSPGSVAEAVAALAGEPDRSRRMGRAGRRRVLREFTLETMADRYLRAYRAAAGWTN